MEFDLGEACHFSQGPGSLIFKVKKLSLKVFIDLKN
jgi:hypothetical protein